MTITDDPIDAFDHELEALLNQRESEMDQDPSQDITHQEFLAHFDARRQP
ncbi:MAG: hypothetical protein WAW39_17245 [Prosthecobacter sp.]